MPLIGISMLLVILLIIAGVPIIFSFMSATFFLVWLVHDAPPGAAGRIRPAARSVHRPAPEAKKHTGVPRPTRS